MAGNSKTAAPASNRNSAPARKDGPWNDIIGLIFIGLALVMTLAMLSYDASDPSWSYAGPNTKVHNWIGPMGAKAADLLFQTFGLAALIWPFTFFMNGYLMWKDPQAEGGKGPLIGIFILVVAITGFLTLLGADRPEGFRLGGFIGWWLLYGPWVGLHRLLGTIGAIVVLLILFFIGLQIGFSISIARYLLNMSGASSLIDDPKEGWLSWFSKWFDEREEPPQNARPDLPKQPPKPRIRTRSTGSGALDPAVAQAALDASAPQPKIPPRPGLAASRKGNGAATPLPPDELDPLDDEEFNAPVIGLNDEFDELDEMGSSEEPTLVKQGGKGKSAASRNAASSDATSSAGPLPPRPTRRLPAKPTPPPPAADEDITDITDETDENGAPIPPRSIEEMVASASVKRADVAEEAAKPRATAKLGQAIKNISRIAAEFKLPSADMLTQAAPRSELAETELFERARLLAEKCAEFNVSGQVKQISPGPVVTTFEFKPDPGVKYSRITNLVDDLCLGLRAESIRIDRIPGKSTVGIEVPNEKREVIRLREIIESKKFREADSKLTLALGKTIDGSNYSADLARMPHLLIAGATGAGKSVALNAILLSLLYKATPDEVKLILIDPKRVELAPYADLPHLLTPIVTDPKRASYALKWAVSEMENRYKHLAAFGVRNIDQYNSEVAAAVDRNLADENNELPKPLPFMVVIIDELADLMMIAAREVEESITRLAQMARAVGIHLVLATQRPSVDVITGLIKANFPSRISFRVSSKVDSRTIIDTNGAEQLLGQGDMLFLGPGTARLIRVHGAYVDEKEVKRVCDFIRSQASPTYNEKVVMNDKESEGSEFGDFAKDEKYDDAVRVVIQHQKASTSLLQRTLRIGYGRAASIIDMMHREGVVGPEDGSKPRQVLVKPDFLERLDQIREEEDF